jgi:hypothetical protein
MDIYSTFPYLCAFLVRAARTQTSGARPEIFLKKPTTERDGPSQDETQITKKKNEPIHQRWWCWPGPLGSFRPRGVSKVDKSSFDCETLFSESFPPSLSLWRNSRLSLSCIYYVLFQIPCSFFFPTFSLVADPNAGCCYFPFTFFFWLKWRAVNLSSFLDLNQQHGGGCCMARCCCCVSPGAQDIYPFYFFSPSYPIRLIR